MSEASGKTFIEFNDLLQALSARKITKTKDGSLSISGNIITNQDFNNLYMEKISEMLSKYEAIISPKFAPTRDLYQTLDLLSSPVLKGTDVPEVLKVFYKKMNTAITSKEDKKAFISGITESVMDGYGTRYSGKDILELADSGIIDAKAPMSMLMYKSLYAQDKKADDYVEPVSYNELLDFYSPAKHPGRLHSIMADGEIDQNFSDFHQELLDNVSKKSKNEYLQDIVDEAKDLAKDSATSTTYSNDLLTYANTRLIPDETLSGNITADFLKAKFIAGEIALSRVLDIYESDPKYFKALEAVLTPTEIEKAHSNDELEDKALMYLPQKSRASYLQKSNAKLSTIMYLFLHCDGISIIELQKLLTSNGEISGLDFYIDEGSHPSRIKELYENYLIDYGCIKTLVSNGILKESDLQKYKLGISKAKIYDSIEKSNSIEIIGSSHTVPISTTGAFIGPKFMTKETSKKSTDLYRILGNIGEDDNINIPTITHKNERNEQSFLNGYKVLPLKPASLVAFLPPEPTKPTYIMPYQETAYILHNKALPESLPENPAIVEIKSTEKMHEDILRIAYQFEETRAYLEKLGYSEDLSFEEAMRIMTEEYMKIRIKGEN